MQAPSRDRHTLRIIVADDNRDTAISASVLLESLGFQVVGIAFDGSTALGLIQNQQPQVAILDITLPDLDGYEVAQRVRQWPITQPKLIAVTGLTRTCDRLDVAAAGFDAYFAKPVDWVSLERLLDSYVPRVSITSE